MTVSAKSRVSCSAEIAERAPLLALIYAKDLHSNIIRSISLLLWPIGGNAFLVARICQVLRTLI